MIRPRWFIAPAFALCIACDLVLARAHIPNSDTVQTLVEATDSLRHNILLDHWVLGVDSFYFTDLPFSLVLTALFGPQLWIIFVAPVLVLALLLLAALLLVARAAPAGVPRWPGAVAVLVLLGLPFTPPQSVFLVGPIHIGSLLFCLLALLIVQPALSGRPLNRKLLPLFLLLLFMACASDPQADAIVALPLLLLMVLRRWLWPRAAARRGNDDVLIFAATLATVVAAALWPTFVAHNHGYATTLNFVPGFVPGPVQAVANVQAVWQSLQLLSDARAATLYGVTWPGLLAATRLVVLCAVLALCLRIAWRMPRARDDGVRQLLVLGAACLFAADVISQGFAVAVSGGPEAPGAAIRYVSSGFVLLVIAAICEAQSWTARGWMTRGGPRRAVGGVAGVFCALSVLAAAETVAAASRTNGVALAPQYPLIQWLERSGLRYGVGDYWSTQMIEALSQGRIAADAVINEPNGLVPYKLVINLSRITAGRHPQFVVIPPPPPNSFGITPANITAAYGAPTEIDQVGKYQIAILPQK